ncbi:MAG: urea ABC transporter permease subunit UrtB [Rikenellaceae bacterium]
MKHKILLTIASLLLGFQLFAQDQVQDQPQEDQSQDQKVMSVSTAITDILSGDKELTSEACAFLITDRSDSTMLFVEELLDGKYNDQVTLARKDRIKLASLKPFIDLHDSSADVRSAAYESIALMKSVQDIALLERVSQSESDKKTKARAIESLYKLYLAVGDADKQGTAIDAIADSEDLVYAQAVREYIVREGVSNTNIAKANKMIKYFDMVERNNNIYQNVFSGLSLGSILILVSLGLSIVYGLAGIINMSHGEFLMIGAYTTYCVQQLFEKFLPVAWFDMAFFLSLPLSFVVAALFGLLIERTVLKHLYSRPLESMLATLGISLILIQLARSIFGDLTTVKAPAILSGGISLGHGLIFPYNRLFIIGLTIVIFIGVYLLFQRTRLGVRIRAVTQNRNMSACVGISTKKIDMITFMFGSGLAGIAGCAITLVGNVVPNMGQTYIVDSFLTVVTGGVGKLAGCAVSGMGIGVLSKVFEAGFEAVYGKVMILLLIIIFLQYKPKGLFADKGRIGDD